MTNILKVNMSKDQITDLIAYAFNAGRVVGRKDARRANVYAVQKDGENRLVTTCDNEIPGLYAVLVASARWSASRGEYVIAANGFLSADIIEVQHLDKPRKGTLLDLIADALDRGVATGVQEHDQAVAINQKAETVNGRALLQLRGFSNTAFFEDREDAELWVHQEVGGRNVAWSVVFTSFESDELVHKIVGLIREETGKYLDGLWKAYVSNRETVEA
jgi:hypothetical protein